MNLEEEHTEPLWNMGNSKGIPLEELRTNYEKPMSVQQVF
jgi:hypothetical protein